MAKSVAINAANGASLKEMSGILKKKYMSIEENSASCRKNLLRFSKKSIISKIEEETEDVL